MNSSIQQALKRFWRLLESDKREVWHLYFYSLFNGMLALTLPLGIQAVFNLVQSGRVSFSWAMLIVFVMLGIALSGILQIVQMYISERIQQRIFTKAAFEFAYRIPKIKSESIDNQHAPELVNRFFEIISIQKGITKTLIDFPASLLQIVFSLILLSLFHPVFIAFGMMVLLFIFLVIRLNAPAGLETSLKESSQKFKVVHWLEELARTMNTFKLSGNTHLPMEKTDQLVMAYLKARKSHFAILVRQFGGLVFFKLIISGVLLIVGGLLVMDGKLGLGQFVASEIIILMLMNSVEKLIASLETIYDVMTALEKIGYFTDIDLEDYGSKTLLPSGGTGIELNIKDLNYHYPGTKKEVLKNINLKLLPNQSVCLAGYNGSGKFTLLKTIAGFYDDFSGELSYDGLPLRNLQLAALRDQIGDCFNDGQVFTGTIIENITMGKPGVDLNQIQYAVRKVFLEDTITSLPKGYNTLIGPGGWRLSKSESVKLVIARCLVLKPRLLLIQDLFGVFNDQQRTLLLDFLFDKSNNWSVVILSNKTDIASRADQTLVMENGEIIISGNYADLKHLPQAIQLFHA